MEQRIISSKNNYKEFDDWVAEKRIHNILLVCDTSIDFLSNINDHLIYLENNGVNIHRFNRFQPNPLYSSVVEGVKEFSDNKCDGIIAIGGGSAIDVAKCIKLYCNMDGDGCDGSYLNQTIKPNNIPFLAMPTTAGTGSEATRYAVIYFEGKKQSVSDYSAIPETVLMDSSVLKTLPIYQKKATMMDAFCHAIESYWSVNSTDESKKYSKKAIELVLEHKDGYLNNTEEGNSGMLLAANVAGKAINITQTTAGHAMCYKITSLFGVAHGHAAILCDRILFPWMIQNTDKCIDHRGDKYLKNVFEEIAISMGCESVFEAAQKINDIFDELGLDIPSASDEQYKELVVSVNPDRLKNNPIQLDEDDIEQLYKKILQ